MRRIFGTTLAIALAATFAGCGGSSPDKARYTVEEYRQNAEARKEQVAKCSNDPGTLGQTPDCINAMQAESIESVGTFKDRFRPRPSNTPTPNEAGAKPAG